MRQWSLGHLTVAGTKPHELVQIAARAGYAAVDPFVGLVEVPGIPMVRLAANDPDTKRFADELSATGLIFNIADAFVLREDTDLDEMRRMIDLVAHLGARSINLLSFDPKRARGTARIAALAEWAGESGLGTMIEFLSISSIGTIEEARETIETIGRPDIGVMVDALHFSYGGGVPSDLSAHAHLIHGAQLCDGPARPSLAEYMRIMIEERGIPGTEELPLAAFMAALPKDLMCSIEVPRLDQPNLVARAKQALEAGRSCDV